MEKNQFIEQKKEVYHKIINVFSENGKHFQNIKSFEDAIEELKASEKAILNLRPGLDKDVSVIFKKKNKIKENLINKVSGILILMQILAYDKKNKKLGREIKNIDTKLLRDFNDLELIRTAQKICDIADKQGKFTLSDLKKIKTSSLIRRSKSINKLERNYGLTRNLINDAENENIKFVESLLVFKVDIDDRKKTEKKISKIIAKTDKMIENKLDRFVLFLADEDPELTNKYNQAKKIHFPESDVEVEKTELQEHA